MSAISYPEAIVVGLVQGISELFPVSSLGHAVLLPAWIGGKWAADLSTSAPHSPYLSVLVAMHVATAAAMVIFFRRDWVRIVGGLITSIRYRKIETRDERLGWLLVIGTIPVGIAGLALDKIVTEDLGRPIPAAIFLTLNGAVLFSVERLQRNRESDEEFLAALRRPDGSDDDTVLIPVVSATETTTPITAVTEAMAVDAKLAKLSFKETIAIGAAQAGALLPGISRSGITMVGGLLRGLTHEESARFAFLLATPVIAAAGLFKIPNLFSSEMSGSLGPAMLGSLLAGIASYFSVRFLTGYFETKTLTPFAIYCLVAGISSLAFFAVR